MIKTISVVRMCERVKHHVFFLRTFLEKTALLPQRATTCHKVDPTTANVPQGRQEVSPFCVGSEGTLLFNTGLQMVKPLGLRFKEFEVTDDKDPGQIHYEPIIEPTW